MSESLDDPRAELAACTGPLLDPDTPPGVTYACLARLEELLSVHTSFRHHERIETGETWLDSGLAISPTQAAMCLRDIRRSNAFVAGLHAAVLEELAKGVAPVRVLYAGCGPYALLALPTMAALTPEDVRFTLLDVHGDCLASVRALVGALGLSAHVAEIVEADATTYEVPGDVPLHVVLTETMKTCLEKEPQVAITRSLLAQAPEAVLVPKSVRVEAFLVDPSKEFPKIGPEGMFGDARDRDRVHLGTAFELSRDSVSIWAADDRDMLPGGEVRMPEVVESRYEPMLLTRIEVFDGILLADRDSGLTSPRSFPEGANPRAGATLKFGYRLGGAPGLVTACLQSPGA